MNKYSELSDIEINKLIADNQEYDYEIGFYFPSPMPKNILDYQYINKKVTKNKKFWKHIDYCQFGKDAFTLMINNKISLNYYDNKGWTANTPILIIDNKFSELNASHSNPCRAIAECYLLMKDECKNDIELQEV